MISFIKPYNSVVPVFHYLNSLKKMLKNILVAKYIKYYLFNLSLLTTCNFLKRLMWKKQKTNKSQ